MSDPKRSVLQSAMRLGGQPKASKRLKSMKVPANLACPEFRSLVTEYVVTSFVVGYPKNMNNSIGPRGEASERFAEMLEEAFGLPVVLWDERLTTMAAERMLIDADVSRKKRKTVIDKMAAVMILQGYLDSKNR